MNSIKIAMAVKHSYQTDSEHRARVRIVELLK
jgi:hypothetical protein